MIISNGFVALPMLFGKDDNGEVVGLADYAKLMEDLPNKIRNFNCQIFT